ncbi:class I SAM-dependent DNA methyltransferase [Parafrankia elaeagni]|uniref:class I SAM-dependent DNA methyltransferase n=1 Tax=Parafrankia elaeagni TaxID=222534 RepID=UPI00036EBCF4|nr:methyltransferase domain-containing protein [Parafrankia elaeagni]
MSSTVPPSDAQIAPALSALAQRESGDIHGGTIGSGEERSTDHGPPKATHRLYAHYASTHAGYSTAADTRLVFERDIAPHLPADRDVEILELGCGQGLMIAQLHAAGFRQARGVDISEEQIATARRNGVHGVECGDLRAALASASGRLDVVTVLDLLEHLGRDELLDVLDLVMAALRPNGIFLARVPNAASPLAGNTVFGDLTHQTYFTPRSLRQALLASGFTGVDIRECPPIPHGPTSAARALVWKGFSGILRLALMAETGSHRGHVVTRTMTVTARASGMSSAHPRPPTQVGLDSRHSSSSHAPR